MKFQDGQTVCHVKTGGEYRVFAGPDRTRIERTGEPAYIYRQRGEPGGTLWVRPQAEMEDGRFEALDEEETGDMSNEEILDGSGAGDGLLGMGGTIEKWRFAVLRKGASVALHEAGTLLRDLDGEWSFDDEDRYTTVTALVAALSTALHDAVYGDRPPPEKPYG